MISLSFTGRPTCHESSVSTSAVTSLLPGSGCCRHALEREQPVSYLEYVIRLEKRLAEARAILEEPLNLGGVTVQQAGHELARPDYRPRLLLRERAPAGLRRASRRALPE